MISDIRFAFRQLLKNPGFTAAAVLTVALGVGVNTTMFTVLNTVILHPSFAADSGRLVSVYQSSPQSQKWPQVPANFHDLKTQSTSFQSLAAFVITNFNLAEPGQPAERVPGMSVSADFFPVLGVAPQLGRNFTAQEDGPGGGRVALISNRFWRSHYDGDPAVVGRRVRMDGQPVTIAGVMPPELDSPLTWGHVDVWQPLAYGEGAWQIREGNGWIQGIGRLRPGVTAAQARAEASTIALRLAHDHPKTNAETGFNVIPWDRDRIAESSRQLCWLSMALAGFVLVIACANLTNLQLARMSGRVLEHALRLALGASRISLIRLFLVESLVLSLAGGALGVLLASVGTRLIGSEIVIGDLPGLDMPIDSTVLLFTLAATVATGAIVGTTPAWIAAKTEVNSTLKQNGRSQTGDRSRHRVRQALIVAELVLALTLLAGAGFLVRGMQRISRADLGWRPDGLMTAVLNLPFNASYATDAQCRAFYDKLYARVTGLPGVRDAAISATLPVTGPWSKGGIAIEGRPPAPSGKEPLTYYNPVTPGYFTAIGARIVRGRDFTPADRADSRQVIIIDEAMADKLWPGEDPIGKRIGDVDPAMHDWREIVGVVSNVHAALEFIRQPDTPFVSYRPLAQVPSGTTHWLSIAVRSSAPASTVGPALRQAVAQLDPDQPVSSFFTAPQAIDNLKEGFDVIGQLLSAFAAVGLALSAVGIYGVIANLVAQRRTEIGIRMALGAQTNDVLWLVLRQGLRLALLGAVIGLACAWALTRVLSAALPSVPGSDPVAILLIAVLLVSVAVLASWLPARGAARIDPVEAIRPE